MPIRSIADLRAQAGADWADSSDEDLINAYAGTIKADPAVVARELGFGLEEGGKNSKRLSSSLDRYQAGLYGVGEEVTKAAGLSGVSDWMGERRRANELRADTDALRAKNMGAVDAWKDVNSVSDFGDYAVGLGIQSLPYLGEAVAGGALGRVAMGGTRAALRAADAAGDIAGVAKAKKALDIGSTVGATAASYPSAVGDILANQREQSGTTDLGSAAALGVPYAAANAVGLEGAAARTSLFRNSLNILDNVQGVKGAVARAGATGVTTGLKEGASETFQEGMNQLGRMAVDPNEAFLSDEAKDRFKESFIGGAVLGGGTGAALGGWRRSTGGEIGQAFEPTETPAPAPAVPVRAPNAVTVESGATYTKSLDENGKPVWTSDQPAPAAQAPAPQVPTAPVVQGGTTAVAQGAQAVQGENDVIQQRLEQQAAREQVIEQFGIASPQDMSKGQFFGQKLFGPAVPQFADALVAATKSFTPVQQELARALAFAHAETGNQLVKFPFNAADPKKTVGKAIEAMGKVFAKFQIGHVQSVDEAAKILDTLSQNAKGQQLEQIDAIHVALTGESTTGFGEATNAKSPKKGPKDEPLQLQTSAGVGSVPAQGGQAGADADSVGPGGLGAVRPATDGPAATDVQADAGAGSVVRPDAAPAGGTAAQAPQVTSGAPSGQATATQDAAPVQAAVQQEGPAAAGPGVQEPAGDAALADGPQRQSLTTDEAEQLADQVEAITHDVMKILITSTSRMDEATAQKQRDFVFTIMSNGPYASLDVMAADFGIKPHQAKDWSAKAAKLREEPTKIKAAFESVAKARGLTISELMARVEAKASRVTKDTQEVDQSISTSKEEGGPRTSDERTLRPEFDAEDVSDREVNDEGLSIKGRKSGESVQERYNAVDTNQAKYLRLSKELEEAENEGNDEAVERIQAELDAVIAKGLEQDAANKRRVKAKAGADEGAAEKPAKGKKKAEPKAEAPVAKREPDTAEMTAAAARFKAVQGDLTQLTDAELEGVKARATKFNNRELIGKVNAELKKRGGEPEAAAPVDEKPAAAAEATPRPAQEQYEAMTKDFPVVAWADLPEREQKQIEDLAKRGKLDLAALNRILSAMPADDRVERRDSFSTVDDYDPSDYEVDRQLRGKSFDETIDWAHQNARNEYERTVLRALKARATELTARGMKFSFKMTDPGRRLSGGALGATFSTPAPLGQAMRVDVVLNGADNGKMSGANYETLVHELLHAVTMAQMKFAPKGTAAIELKALYNELVKQYNARAKAGTLHPWEKTFWKGENNSLADADELLAWGLTNREFQEYLASIEVAPRVSLWDRFVQLISKALGIPVRANSALAQFMSISENLLGEPIDPYVKEANSRFQSLGKQANTTKFPSWALDPQHGAPAWIDGDYVLYSATATTGKTIFVPGMRSGDTVATARVDVSAFKGGSIPAAQLAKMIAVADSLRTKVNALTREAAIEQLPEKLQAPTRTVATNTWTTVKKAGLALAITEDVINMAKKHMASAADYLKAQYDQQATRLQFELKVEQILQQYDKLPKAVQGTGAGSVNEFIFDATTTEKWGFAPSYSPGVQIDPEMKKRFDAMPAAAQKLIRDVFDHGHQALVTKQAAVKAAADAAFKQREQDAQGDVGELQRIALDRRAFEAKFDRLLKIKDNKPYAYLGRYGNYVAVAKSAEYVEAEKLAAEGDLDATKWLKQNESNGNHYIVSFGETQGEADQIAAGWKGTGRYAKTEAFAKMDGSAYVGGGDLFLAFARMRNMVTRKANDGLVTANVFEGINKLLTDLYLMSVAESSAHTSSMQRRNIAGADKDMMRNLATRGRADAHFLASLKHGEEVTNAVDRMTDEAKGNRREAMPLLNEILKRQAQSMEYKLPGTLARNLTQVSTLWFLSTSPVFYLQQVLQTAVLSLPFMAGRIGYFRSVRAINQAYRDVGALVKGLGVNDHVDYSKAPADVRGMLQTLVGMGKIDVGIDSDAKARASDQGPVDTVMRKLQGVNTRIETINRATAAIAAYRAYLQKYGSDKIAAATQYAADVVSNTHGSYDGFNTPRALASDVGRVVGQFKRFQIIQLSMLAKLMHTAFKGASKDEKAVARQSLKFITAHMAVLGGALGVPFVSQLGNILLGIFGDDDEPKNLEQLLREAVGGGALADLLVRGVPGAVGLESLGKKVTMENVASLLPFTDVDLSSRDGLTQVLVGLLGPSVGLSLKMADGMGMIGNGDYYKGLELMLPTGVSNAMKGYRFAESGVSMRNGDTVLGAEDIALVDATFQALGLPTNTISDRQRIQQVVANTDKFFEEKAADIKRDYSRAFKSGDSGAMQDAREAWMSLQDARSRNGYARQPLSTLFRAPQDQLTRERNVVGGVEFNRNNRLFVEEVANQ